jgi:hypothetical protein
VNILTRTALIVIVGLATAIVAANAAYADPVAEC